MKTASCSPVQRALSYQHTFTGKMYEVCAQVLVTVSYVPTNIYDSKTVLRNHYNKCLNL